MKTKYNLALLPTTKSTEFIKFAEKFSDLSDSYLLGKNSLPHVTLYQFWKDKKEINTMWESVLTLWQRKPLKLVLSELSYTTYKNIFWLALLPNNRNVLHKMHAKIADLLELPIKSTFDPHLTLINTIHAQYESEAKKLAGSYASISDTFVLALGKSDEMGQFTKIIHTI